MAVTWKNITVGQFLDIYRLSINNNDDDFTKIERLICIVYNKTEREVEEMNIVQFNKLASECNFLLKEKIPGKPQRKIKIGKNKYSIEYNPRKLRYRQYVEILHFSDKPIENMHYIMASIVKPLIAGFIPKRNIADDHPKISHYMLNAKVIDVYHSCVFFCKLYSSSIKIIKDYLVLEMIQKGMTREIAEIAIEVSINVMDGFTAPNKWPILKD